jgi:diguanylate cyclase (GGDEF)-like protein
MSAYLAESIAILGHCAQLLAIRSLLRLRTYTKTSTLVFDSLIVLLVLLIAGWTTIIVPSAALYNNALLPSVVFLAYIPLTLVVGMSLFRLVMADRLETRGIRLLMLGNGIGLVGELLFAVTDAGVVAIPYSSIEPVLIMAYVVGASAAVHPSMRTLERREPLILSLTKHQARQLFVGLAFLVPVIRLGFFPPASSVDQLVLTILSLLLALATILRFMTTARNELAAQRQLTVSLTHDRVTGLPNRAAFRADVETAIIGTELQHVLLVGFERFRHINDTLGHETGDELLRQAADRILKHAPTESRLYRSAGADLLLAVAGATTAREIAAIADHIATIFQEPFSFDGNDYYLTAQIGAYQMAAAENPALTLRNVESALYSAKDAKKSFSFFDQERHARITKRVELENDLRRAIERDELYTVQQAIVKVSTESVAGFETLLRWNRNKTDFVSPGEFIPIAEDTGLILPIGRWTFDRALAELAELKRRSIVGPDATVSVNLSPRQFQDNELLDALDAAVARHRVDPRSIWLEVTESIMMEDPARARRILDAIVDRGIRIAVDDFGTGYSSLSLLDQYPLARLKIDRAFVKELDQPKTKLTLVRSMVVMAHTLGMDVVAEGVETIGQANIIADLGADFIQGFYYAKPVRIEDIPHVVTDVNRIRAQRFASSIEQNGPAPIGQSTNSPSGTYASGL